MNDFTLENGSLAFIKLIKLFLVQLKDDFRILAHCQ